MRDVPRDRPRDQPRKSPRDPMRDPLSTRTRDQIADDNRAEIDGWIDERAAE
jgi:hypothetical protein